MFRKLICSGPSLIRTGCVAMILAVAWHRFVHPGPHLTEDMIDGVWGFLNGITIGTWLLVIRVNARARSGRGSPPGAGTA